MRDEGCEANLSRTAGWAVGGGGQSGAESGAAGAGCHDGPRSPTWAEAEVQDWQVFPRGGDLGEAALGKGTSIPGPVGCQAGQREPRGSERLSDLLRAGRTRTGAQAAYLRPRSSLSGTPRQEVAGKGGPLARSLV